MENAERAQPFELPPTPFARVLVVEDEEEQTQFYAWMLNSRGYEVALAYDGVQAIRSALLFKPHVMVLNLVMPRMSGDQVLRAMRQDPRLRGIKVILTSAGRPTEEIARSCEADDWLDKPFAQKLLLEKVERALSL